MKPAIFSFLVLTVAIPLLAQQPAAGDSVPVFHVNVVQNTVTAVNYAYRQGPTGIDFRGTVLMPEAKGNATVESKRGHTEIDANLERMLPPQRFGREYLTYTLWAITPEGGVRNLAEIVPGPNNKAHVRVSTDLQAFGLIVTAEPYSAARRPSNVVVLENVVRPDTTGKVEQVQAKYELMPRGEYTWQEPAEFSGKVANAPKVSMNRYEAILEIYEAQNALGIAQAANAPKYAPQTYAKAQQLYLTAQQLEGSKGDTGVIVQDAREAVETAEDARMIAERREQEETLTRAQSAAANAQQAKLQAEQQAQAARAEADEAQARAEAEKAARERAEADAARARTEAAQAQANQAQANQAQANQAQANQAQAARDEAGTQAALQKPQVTVVVPEKETKTSQLRMSLLEQMNGSLPTRDTARGLMTTIPDNAFSGADLHSGISTQLARMAKIVQAHPGLHVTVEGNSDSSANDAKALERAESVRDALTAQGIPDNRITVRGLGDTRLFGPNSTAAGREANRRVDVIVSGAPIGDLPFWDHTYALSSR